MAIVKKKKKGTSNISNNLDFSLPHNLMKINYVSISHVSSLCKAICFKGKKSVEC